MKLVCCVLGLAMCSATTLAPRPPAKTTLVAAKSPVLPTPAAKILDVGWSACSETALLMLILKAATLAMDTFMAPDASARPVIYQLTWLLLVQGSSRLQGVCQISRPTKTINPEWYDKLVKPSWNPPPWAFPAAWIPLKILQTIAANLAWQALGRKTLAVPIVLFLLHIALGDVWNVQFFVKQRPLTGVFTIFTFWGVLIATTVSLYGANPLSGLLVAPTIAWVLVASCLNLDVWYLNQ